uniref:procollagen-proline 4-dioxygenase n=1 Tax=Saccoglossus kowalevskii TaxID=10224 RepID=A0ABM0GR22_SACKO|nr:PREDICTED: prolyl 4-hydroxylase subunit alpha-1-like [Saccoglossus kowalevskii]
MASTSKGILACSVLLLCFSVGCCEFFTALSDLERLVHKESEMVQSLKQYILMEQAKLDELNRMASELEVMSLKASKDPEEYLHHPVNAFLLVKRLLSDWNTIEETVKYSHADEYVRNISDHQEWFPGTEDLTGAVNALFRLQDTYKLDSSDIAEGRIIGATDSPTLNAQECFELGRVAYVAGDNYHTVIWMKEALRQLTTNNSSDEATILDYLSYSTYMVAILIGSNIVFLLDPEHVRGLGNKAYFEQELAKYNRQRGDDADVPGEEEKEFLESHKPLNDYLPEREAYEALCRGEQVKMSPQRQKKLKCRLRDYNRPFLILQPAKEEVVFDKPKLIIFHDAILTNEIRKVKALASPRLRRATIQNSVTGNLEFAEYRISKSAWLSEDDGDVVHRLNHRIEQYTGLTMDTAEELQVANYGLGGHYEPHFDFARKEEINAFKSLNTGNRIATFLFYMSDVEAGGATVFPQVGARLIPEKGSAAFWYNLLKNGEGDYSTRHAACPVLVGSKWVSNKWIHERGQEFRHKCGATEEEV